MSWFIHHWEFVLATVIAIVLAVWPIWLYRRSKHIDWELVADEPIYGMGAATIASRLSLRYDGLPLQNPRLITLRLINTGAHEVRESDFTGNDFVKVSVPRAGTLAEANVAAVSNSRVCDVGPINQALANVELRPKLMKPKDWLKLQVIVDGGGRPVVSGTFHGQTRAVRDRWDVFRARVRFFRWCVFAFMVLAAAVMIIQKGPVAPVWMNVFTLGAAVLFSTVVFNGAYAAQHRYYRPRQ